MSPRQLLLSVFVCGGPFLCAPLVEAAASGNGGGHSGGHAHAQGKPRGNIARSGRPKPQAHGAQTADQHPGSAKDRAQRRGNQLSDKKDHRDGRQQGRQVADKNGDGKLGPRERAFDRADKNNDGKLSQRERLFNKADKNDDGHLSQREREHARDALERRRQHELAIRRALLERLLAGNDDATPLGAASEVSLAGSDSPVGGDAGQGERFHALLKRLDANGNGRLDAPELKRARELLGGGQGKDARPAAAKHSNVDQSDARPRDLRPGTDAKPGKWGATGDRPGPKAKAPGRADAAKSKSAKPVRRVATGGKQGQPRGGSQTRAARK